MSDDASPPADDPALAFDGAAPLPTGDGAAPAEPPPAAAAEAAGAAAPEGRREAFRDGLGRALFAAGTLTLPLGVGAALGYWVSDRGVRWVPDMVGGLIVLWIVALVAMIAGLYLLGPAAGHRVGRKRIVGLALLVILAAVARVGVDRLARPSPLSSMPAAAFDEAFRRDARRFRELDHGLRRVVALLERQPGLFDGTPRPLSGDEEALVADAWASYVHTAFALDQVRSFYEDYYTIDLSRGERERHVKSFLLTFAAELALFETTARLVGLVEENPDAAKFLDLPRGDLPEGTFARAREELAGLSDLSRVVAGERYRRWLDRIHDARREAVAGGYDDLWDEVSRLLGAVEQRRGVELATLAAAADAAPLERRVKGLVFPVQAKVAEWMGDTRVKRAGSYLIAPSQLQALREDLRPGDVLLGRKNWYLSNVGLPGFWPHAMLYAGTPEEMAAAFDEDAETRAWVERTCGEPLTFTAFMARTYPLRWSEHVLGAQGDDPLVVVEAISEGVSQTSLGHAAGDYLVAMRPGLPTWVKAQALYRAFSYVGRPYDFDFDFATDHALVCTELVWRSYRPLDDAPGLRFELETVAGRRTLPANEIARLFQAEHGRDDAQLTFVAFLDGREKEQRAVEADEAAFLATPDRPKWDVAQE